MRIVAIVPSKGKSERIPNKNIAVLDGDYLFKRKIKQLLGCPRISEVYLDTESDEIAELAGDLPVKRLIRPVELASNDADGHEIFAWAANKIGYADIYIQALCTAPFVDTDTINRALDQLIKNPNADSLVATRGVKQYVWSNDGPEYGHGRIPNSIDLPKVTTECMSLYMVKCKHGQELPTRRFGQSPILFELSQTEDLDINCPNDLLLAEQIAAGKRAMINARLAVLKPFLSSSLLSDISADKGLTTVLPPNLVPISSGKILGMAKTLKLRSLISRERKNEDWRGIYKALDSYRFVRPGDVIIASTDIPERAYFGELNATIALRSGAVGAIIDGYTRDTSEVRALGFPIYAHGSYCHDIMYEGTLEEMNKPIKIGDVFIKNNDIIFGDDDGVVVIPEDKWPVIQEIAIQEKKREIDIRTAIISGRPLTEILEKSGYF